MVKVEIMVNVALFSWYHILSRIYLNSFVSYQIVFENLYKY
jgi:hypothetical protein